MVRYFPLTSESCNFFLSFLFSFRSYSLSIKDGNFRAGKTAQWIKHLLCKHENLSLGSQNLCTAEPGVPVLP